MESLTYCARYGVLGVPRLKDLPGGESDREPPVPIPNTEVKPVSADGTWGGIPWESRSPPGIKSRRAARLPLAALLKLKDICERPIRSYELRKPFRPGQ